LPVSGLIKQFFINKETLEVMNESSTHMLLHPSVT
jgi:hypothetical protein